MKDFINPRVEERRIFWDSSETLGYRLTWMSDGSSLWYYRYDYTLTII